MDIELESTGPAPVPPGALQVMIAMRDGTALATDVYRPAGPGPWPAVLVRLPYDKDGRYTFMPWLAPRFTARGYVFVVQDMRGKFRSEGEARPFTHESADGYDTIDWVSRQEWCSGAVGMFGDSYYGFTQWCAVASGHPALRAIVPPGHLRRPGNLAARPGGPAVRGHLPGPVLVRPGRPPLAG